MSPRFVLGWENVPCVAEVVNRSLKANCKDFTYICNWLSGYISMSRVIFRPRFHSDYLAPSATALSKRLTMVQMFLLNCLPPPICVLKHARTRLIILTTCRGGREGGGVKRRVLK